MRNFRNSILERRLPQGLGVLVLALSVGTIFWLSGNAILFGTKAAIGNIPKNMQVSNIDAQSFTVSYTTDSEVSGSITYGTDPKFGKVAFDKRDINTPVPHYIHYVVISNLTPSTRYYFSIISADKVFDDNSSPFSVTTAQSTNSGSEPKKLSGLVTLEGGNTPPEAIAYVQTDKSAVLSALVQPDGSYSIPLEKLLKKDLSSLLDITTDSILKMKILNQTLESSISLLASQINPVPTVVLSKNYDFSISINPLSGDTASKSAETNDFPSLTASDVSPSIQIIVPTADEEFKDFQPTFSGKAFAGNNVDIKISSTPETAYSVQADQNGDWEYRPESPLEPGKYSITIKSADSEGSIKTLDRSFTILAAGSQFIEPSVSPTLEPSPTVPEPTATIIPLSPTTSASPTVAPTAVPSISPTEAPTATPVITATPTFAPTGTPVPQITTPPIPKSGSSAFVFGAFGISALIGIGSLLFFLL